jgi:integrase/recombinase XerD
MILLSKINLALSDGVVTKDTKSSIILSSSYQNQAINAIKFYYERVLGGPQKCYLIYRPKEEKTLPIVLNEKEITDLLKSTENIKHKAILMLCYSAGLRLSELMLN